MEFIHFLHCYLPSNAYGGRRVYRDMVEQAVTAEALGYRGIGIPEHHLMNFLMCPAPLQMAVKIAGRTQNVELITSVVVLPVHDMRILAGEIAQADMLCDGRLIVGAGRGAFAYEVARLGTPLEQTREKFGESFALLQKLLSEEEVSWNGKYYKFASLTTMPRPMQPVRYMVAAMAPESIYFCAKQGLHVQTTALGGSHEMLVEQVESFERGRDDAEVGAKKNKLYAQRVLYAARDAKEARQKIELAYEYYKRFDNVFTGPGRLTNGFIDPLPREQTIEELGNNLLICPVAELIDRLGAYAEVGIDHVIASGFGAPHEDTIDMMHRFAEEVMPHFRKDPVAASASLFNSIGRQE